MAFNKSPSSWFGAGYSASDNAIHLNTGDAGSNKTLSLLTDSAANATTGDIRYVLFAIMEAISQAWMNKAPADRPKQMTITRGITATASNSNVETRSYTISFRCNRPTDSTASSLVRNE